MKFGEDAGAECRVVYITPWEKMLMLRTQRILVSALMVLSSSVTAIAQTLQQSRHRRRGWCIRYGGHEESRLRAEPLSSGAGGELPGPVRNLWPCSRGFRAPSERRPPAFPFRN